MQRRLWRIAIAAAASVLLLGALAFWGIRGPGRRHTSRPSVEPAGLLAFQVGGQQRRSYAWSVTTSVWRAEVTTAAPTRIALEGRMNIHRFLSSGRSMLGLQMSPLRVWVSGARNANMEAAFGVPFVMEIDGRGEFGASRFSVETADGDRAILDAIARTLQVVLPGGPARRWDQAERDQNGSYLASYVREGEGAAITKRKVRYSSAGPEGVFAIRVVSSKVQAELDAAGPWLARSVGAEQLRLIGPDHKVLATVETRFALGPATPPPSDALGVWSEEVLRSIRTPLHVPSQRRASAWDETALEKERTRLTGAGVTLGTLLAGLTTRDLKDAAFADEFASYLRVFPAETQKLVPGLKRLGEPAAALLFNILERAGTLEAQKVVLEVIEGPAHGVSNRMRALVALGGFERPSDQVVNRLIRFYEAERLRADAGGLTSTALLALGAMGHRLTDEPRARIARKLEQELRSASGPARQRLVLLAISNARLTLAWEDQRRYLHSTDPLVREAAVRSVANGGDPRAAAELAGLLATEEVRAVYAATISALTQLPPSEQTNTAIASAFAQRRDDGAELRAQMVAYLASQMEAYPRNRSILEQSLRHETNRHVLVAILNSLSGR
jgi:hypothetical protein